MTRILMRAGKTPFEALDALEIASQNTLSNNSGNLLFSSSMFKVLSAPGADVVVNRNRIQKPEEADRINAEFDMLVIPLANAFKPGKEHILRQWTGLVKKLTIPCVVTGVGAQAGLSNDDLRDPALELAVKEFVAAILDKSSTIGVRGEYTREYLARLGFSAIDVIGCPSMFTNGGRMNVSKKVSALSENSEISFNFTRKMPQNICEFLRRTLDEKPRIHYVPQDLDDMRLMLWGRQFSHFGPHDAIPNRIDHPVFKEGRALYFTDSPTWISFMRRMDFTFGTRIHGNIAALISGTPGFVVAHDSRTLELAEYFEIPHIRGTDITGSTTVDTLYDAADYTRLNDGHQSRFSRFTAFLERNGIDHIYRHTGAPESFDKRLFEVDFLPPLRPYTSESHEVLSRRTQGMIDHFNSELRKTEALERRLSKLEVRQSKLEVRQSKPRPPLWRRFGRLIKNNMIGSR